MNKIIFNSLYIFSLKEQKAFSIPFIDGINVVTSDKLNGNKKGKSVVMKSIYHTLGADSYFEDKWENSVKTYILDISINGEKYYFIRFNDLFKIFNNDYQLVFQTENRSKLTEKLKDLFNFSIQLPNRQDGILELTPPAFSYILNYLDQDKMSCSKFASFRSLEQYSNFKESALYSHFGVFNEEYYLLSKKIKDSEIKKDKCLKEIEMLNVILKKLESEIAGTEYSESNSALDNEIENTKKEYEDIVTQLNKSRSKIIELRNTKSELEISINSLKDSIKSKETILKKFNNHTCPVCNSDVEPIYFKHDQYDKKDDYLFVNQQIELNLIKISEDIEKEENLYRDLTNKLNAYNNRIKKINKNIDSVIKHKGFIEMRDKIYEDLSNVNKNLNQIEERLKSDKKLIKKYLDLKKQVDNRYYELMCDGKNRFDLKEIKDERFEKIKNNFEAGGSNRPISTIIWYFNLIRLKGEFNPNAIKFPVVLDSPNNAELDENKRKELFEYIFDNIDNNTQLIVSTLGFDANDFQNSNVKNIVSLDNKAYELLSNENYVKNIDFYKKFLDNN